MWSAVGGAWDSEGRMIGKPAELVEAEVIVALCERFHCLPSALLREDVGFLKLLEIHALGHPPEVQ